MQKRSVVNSSSVTELKQKRHKVLKRKILLVLIALVILIVGVSFSLRIDKFNINEIKISGNIVIDTNSIQTIVQENLKGNYLFIFPKTNFLIYPKQKILKELATTYKRLNNISLNVTDFKTLTVSVNEYEGKYLYCGEMAPELDSGSEQKCYFLDSNGYIFDEAPFFSGEIFFKFYGSMPNIEKENPQGDYFNPLIFPKLIKFKEFLEQTGFKPLSVWVNGQNEVYFSLSTLGIASTNPKIILNTDFDYEKIAENFEAAVVTEPLQTKLKKNYDKLLYLDLRFGNKVHFKFNE